jgi:putative Holliday junction resolvase
MARGGVLAIDHGTKRSGFAWVDALRIAPVPLDAFEGSAAALAEHVARLLAERDARVVLVGLPQHMQGGEGARAAEVRAFARELATRHPALEVVLHDERLTTKAAEELLREADVPRRDRRRLKDSLAALVLLRDWIEAGEPR